MILEDHIRKLDVPCIFTRDANDTHNRKTSVYLKKTVHLRLWDEGQYKEGWFTLMIGTDGQPEKTIVGNKEITRFHKVLRVFWHHNVMNMEVIEDFRMTDFEGITIDTSEEEEVISRKEALALIESGRVMFLNEDLSKRTLYVVF